MPLVPVHVAAGVLAILSGYVALAAPKGARVHRRSGLIFTAAMLVMSLSGAVIAVGRPGMEVNIPAGLVTAYLIVTAYLTVQAPSVRTRAAERVAMIAAFVIGGVAAILAVRAFARGYPGFAIPALMFGAIAIGGGAGDRRMQRNGGINGAPRLKRHLWRMCTALFIAAASFFLGPPARVPEPLRTPPFRMIPLIALAAMVFWLWRMRTRRKPAPVLSVDASEAI